MIPVFWQNLNPHPSVLAFFAVNKMIRHVILYLHIGSLGILAHLVRGWLGCPITSSAKHLGSITILRRLIGSLGDRWIVNFYHRKCIYSRLKHVQYIYICIYTYKWQYFCLNQYIHAIIYTHKHKSLETPTSKENVTSQGVLSQDQTYQAREVEIEFPLEIIVAHRPRIWTNAACGRHGRKFRGNARSIPVAKGIFSA